MLELDLQITRDGVLVVAHDETLERCTDGTGRIADHTLTELLRRDAGYRFTRDGGASFPFRGQGVRIPTLSQILLAFPELRLNLDLKVDLSGIETVLADAIRHEAAARRVCCGSELDGLAARLSGSLPEVCMFYPRRAATDFVTAALSDSSLPLDDRYHVLDIPLYLEKRRLVSTPLLDAARSSGRWINVWTVDDPVEMRLLTTEGIGGIITDRPDILRNVLDEAAIEAK